MSHHMVPGYPKNDICAADMSGHVAMQSGQSLLLV